MAKTAVAALLWLISLAVIPLPAQTNAPVESAEAVALSDEDVWAFIVYLYGYDEEERDELASLNPDQKAKYINNVRGMSGEMMVKNPRNFTPEEKLFIDSMRVSFYKSKNELRTAIAHGQTLDQAQAEVIIELAHQLLQEYRNGDNLTALMYSRGHPQFPIPAEWAFLDPQKIWVRENVVEVQLFINLYRPNGPQVRVWAVQDEDTGDYKVSYRDNLGTRKSWLVDAPRSQKRSTHGSVQNRH